jgi:23S rRNA pseudouridine2605 synthase
MVGHPPHRSDDEDAGQAATVRGERVAKALSRAGVASRREIERMIAGGRVALNGEILLSPAVRVGIADRLTIDGKAAPAAEPTRLFRYHKPVGLVTTHGDPKGRATVFQAIPAGLPRLISVGRLDITSEGLLLLTNDGELARALELPSGGWRRRYRARVFGQVDPQRLDDLRDGITVGGIRYGPIEATRDQGRAGSSPANSWLTLTLTEGKNREIRRVLEALGLTVNRLIRTAYGPFLLADLVVGEVAEVSPAEIRRLGHVGARARLPTGEKAGFRPSPQRNDGSGSPRAPGRLDAPASDRRGGWAKPEARPSLKRPGSAPEAALTGGPREPSGSSSPRRSSRARRRGHRREGGPTPGA